MHKNATKCNETLSKWCKNKHGASKIIDTLETYHIAALQNRFIASYYNLLTCPAYRLQERRKLSPRKSKSSNYENTHT
jgi:hypothetical protein